MRQNTWQDDTRVSEIKVSNENPSHVWKTLYGTDWDIDHNMTLSAFASKHGHMVLLLIKWLPVTWHRLFKDQTSEKRRDFRSFFADRCRCKSNYISIVKHPALDSPNHSVMIFYASVFFFVFFFFFFEIRLHCGILCNINPCLLSPLFPAKGKFLSLL